MDNLEHFDIISIISGVLWLILTVILATWYKSRMKDLHGAKYFLPTFYFKLFSALGFSLVYLLVYAGGDTFAYWDGALKLTNLFYDSPIEFVSEMYYEAELTNIRLRFNDATGYPPGWIYKEPESFFVSKVLFFLSLITFKSYWAATIILAYISTRISFSFYQVLVRLKLNSERLLMFAVLFLPSVSFWCSGISKDTIVYLALILFMRELISLYYLKSGLKFSIVLGTILSVFLIFHIRIYVLFAVIPALLVAYTRVIEVKNKANPIKRVTLKMLFYVLGVLTLLIYSQVSSGGISEVFQEIIITQQDFKNNETYGDNKYTIDLDDYSATSIVKSIPQAIIAAIYRPFLWESGKVTLILNGIEGSILLFLTFQLFFVKFREKIVAIRKSELLIFSLVFVIIMGFSLGFTSGLFGVLVRLKAIILPFFLFIVGLQIADKKSEEETLTEIEDNQ